MGPASVQCFTSVRLQLEASPKAISRRTSYLRVRLEFLRYPHLITTFFNTCVFGSSKTFYGSFNLDMDRSPGFGSTNTNSTPYSDLVSLRLRTFSVLNLAGISNSPDRSTKSTPSARRPLTVCKHKVSGSLSLPSRGPFHLSFTVLLHYRSLGSI